MWHGLAAFFGVAAGDGNSVAYLFWSGIGSDLAYLSFMWGAIVLYRRHSCRVRWCPRIGRHEWAEPDTGVTRLLCWKHHPDVTRKQLSRLHLHIHREADGAAPGRAAGGA